MKPLHFVITCEHAVNFIPPPYEPYFAPHVDLLKTHQGYDIGALEIAQTLAKALNTTFFQATTSRLLIELNRSLTHHEVFSCVTKKLPHSLKQALIEEYYQPYHDAVIHHFKKLIAQDKTILHFSIHSFTPIFNHHVRKGDLCLLYDARREAELDLAITWQSWLKTKAPDLFIRRNYPYMGKTDGLASTCRTLFKDSQYLGFEIESNQAIVVHPENQTRFGNLLADMVKPLISK
jgi:predicted N-formylglutamate amidohydrolase